MIGEGCVYIPAVLRDYPELKRWIEFCEIPTASWFPVTITERAAQRIARGGRSRIPGGTRGSGTGFGEDHYAEL